MLKLKTTKNCSEIDKYLPGKTFCQIILIRRFERVCHKVG